ncbi:MAG: methyltransferase domain-containing protein [Bacteroidota bacterium]
MANTFAPKSQEQEQRIESYYKFQSKIYDSTRWTFLFGRKEIIHRIPLDTDQEFHLAEIGCGTGFNMEQVLKRFKNVTYTGIDVSPDMVALASAKGDRYLQEVRILEEPYQAGKQFFHTIPQVILFSYSLTMINPQWTELIDKAYEDLEKGGYIMVTDFHDSQFGGFKKHMQGHHVRMDGHLLPYLQEKFSTLFGEVKKAYGGVWEYVLFGGQK